MSGFRITVEGAAADVFRFFGWDVSKPFGGLATGAKAGIGPRAAGGPITLRAYKRSAQMRVHPDSPWGSEEPASKDGEWVQSEGASVLSCAGCDTIKMCRATRPNTGDPVDWRCYKCSVGHYAV